MFVLREKTGPKCDKGLFSSVVYGDKKEREVYEN